MIQDGTIVNITDNAGDKIGKVFKILGASKKRYATIGDKVVVAVRVAEPRKNVKKKDVQQAVVVRVSKSYRRKDGSYIRFDDNAVVMLEKDKMDPKGGRIFGPIPRELAEKGYKKIISLAQEVI